MSFLGQARADEGWWPLSSLPQKAVSDRYRFEIRPSWVQRVQRGTIRLRGPERAQVTSGVMVSVRGLVLSSANACGPLPQSSWAAKRIEDERPCPGLHAEILDTYERLDRLPHSERDRARLMRTCSADRCALVSMHEDSHWIYRYSVYKDVRLVFRSTQKELPVAFLRLYRSGKPAKTKNIFRIQRGSGPRSQPVFALGHPGPSDRRAIFSKLSKMAKSASTPPNARALLRSAPFIENARRRELRVLRHLHAEPEHHRALLDAWPALEDHYRNRRKPPRALQLRIEAAHHRAMGEGLYPDGNFTLRLSYGKLSPPSEVSASAMEMRADVDIGPGSGGGPLFDKRGVLLGVVIEDKLPLRSLRYAPQDTSLAIDVQGILRTLAQDFSVDRLLKELR